MMLMLILENNHNTYHLRFVSTPKTGIEFPIFFSFCNRTICKCEFSELKVNAEVLAGNSGFGLFSKTRLSKCSCLPVTVKSASHTSNQLSAPVRTRALPGRRRPGPSAASNADGTQARVGRPSPLLRNHDHRPTLLV